MQQLSSAIETLLWTATFIRICLNFYDCVKLNEIFLLNNYLLTKSQLCTGKSQTKTLAYWPSNCKAEVSDFPYNLLANQSMHYFGYTHKPFNNLV